MKRGSSVASSARRQFAQPKMAAVSLEAASDLTSSVSMRLGDSDAGTERVDAVLGRLRAVGSSTAHERCAKSTMPALSPC